MFLASPGDLDEERTIARGVVDDLNRSVCKPLNLTIDLLVWEDVLPGMGRPQGRINPEVDRCDLFVGLLWRRWGTPTGTHTSGFLEEFERARDRFRSSREPEIWIHFKDIGAEQESDPGPQLGMVIAFKDALAQSREVSFKEFATAADWERMFQNNLSQYAAELTMAEMEKASSQPEGVVARSTPDAATLPSHDDTTGATTLGAAASAWRDAAASEGGAALAEVSDENAARMLMSVKTWTAMLRTGDLIGVHEANFMFAHREACDDLLGLEPQFVFQSILGDSGDVIPGWYWLREASAELIGRWTESALSNSLTVVRRGATALLSKWPNNPLLPELYELFPRLLGDQDQFVRWNTLTALVTLGTDDALAMLDAASTRGSDEQIADARRFVGLQLRPEGELARIIDEAKPITSRVRRQAVASAANISVETATRGLASTEARIRYACALLLRAKGALSEPASRGLLVDAALGVRRVGFLSLIALGAPVTLQEVHAALNESKSDAPPQTWFLRDDSEQPKEDEVVAALFDRMTETQLAGIVHFYLPDGREAYAALARNHFTSMRERIRRDLDEDYATLRSESQENVRLISPNHADALLKVLESSEAFIRGRLVDAAMTGIADHGDQSDLGRVRRVLATPATFANREAVAEGIRFLERVGTRDDVPRLVALALQPDDLPHDVQSRAAALALRLAESDMGVAEQLLDRANVVVVDAVFRYAIEVGAPDLSEQATSRLRNPVESIRRAALTYLALRLGRTEAADTLKRYMT